MRDWWASAAAACALRTDSTIHCWGEEDARQFGMLDAPAGSFAQISAGLLHFCAIRSNQTVTCWGDNGAGQLDAPSGRFASISSAEDLTCGVRSDGSAACWGTVPEIDTEDINFDLSGFFEGPLESLTLGPSGG